jgi:outer membrane immunogenic protein
MKLAGFARQKRCVLGSFTLHSTSKFGVGDGDMRLKTGSVLAVVLGVAATTLATGQLASATDLAPVRRAPPPAAPAYVPAPVFSWTGFYIGGNLGAAWTHVDVADSFGDGFSRSQEAVFTGGGQVGANYQWNWLVVGVEADFDWLANNHNSSDTFVGPGGDSFRLSANDRWITMLAGRVGVAFNTLPNWLFYGRGGGGWVGANDITLTNVTTGESFSTSNSNSKSGWLVGGGIEWAFAPNWTAKIEYNKLFLDSSSFTVQSGPLTGDVVNIFHRDVQTLTVGVNYLFNWH